MANGIPDHSGAAGAEALAQRIEAFWHSQGFPAVVCTAEYFEGTAGSGGHWGVKSNLRGALPPAPRQQLRHLTTL